MHDQLRVGQLLDISHPRNNFRLVDTAARYIFIAGGIGITPILPMIEQLARQDADFSLYYCSRTAERAAFRTRVTQAAGARAHFVYDAGVAEHGLNVDELLRSPQFGTHVYCCGPTNLMAAARRAAQVWPVEHVHFEFFAPESRASGASTPDGDEEFTIELSRTGQRFIVPSGKSIVEVLREHHVPATTSCEVGTCGTCRTKYLSGSPNHRDYVLDDAERHCEIMICCSRAQGLLVLDL